MLHDKPEFVETPTLDNFQAKSCLALASMSQSKLVDIVWIMDSGSKFFMRRVVSFTSTRQHLVL